MILVGALLCLAPAASWADLAPYSQDFEGLVPVPDAGPPALADDGWLVFANVFSPDGTMYYYGYGPFPAPNNGGAFSAVVVGQGGPSQGAQQLTAFSDYNNGDHGAGNLIESNVFQEQVIGAADAGTTWLFKFDAKRDNIAGATTAKAFFKTIDPATGYSLTNFIWIDMTNVPDSWTSYTMPFSVDPGLVGQILQFGFLNTATNYEGSGILYDNVALLLSVGLDIKPGSCPNPIQNNSRSRGLGRPSAMLSVAVPGTDVLDVYNIDVDSLQLQGVSPVRWGYEDVAEPYTGDLCGCTQAGPDGLLDLTLKFRTQDLIAAIGEWSNGDVKLTLTGTLLDGTPFEGVDCAVIAGGIGCGAKPDLPLEPEILPLEPRF